MKADGLKRWFRGVPPALGVAWLALVVAAVVACQWANSPEQGLVLLGIAVPVVGALGTATVRSLRHPDVRLLLSYMHSPVLEQGIVVHPGEEFADSVDARSEVGLEIADVGSAPLRNVSVTLRGNAGFYAVAARTVLNPHMPFPSGGEVHWRLQAQEALPAARPYQRQTDFSRHLDLSVPRLALGTIGWSREEGEGTYWADVRITAEGLVEGQLFTLSFTPV
ncbi:MAG: hypothetical protein M3198_06525 [Actinomycetota bacterium]|nr:hypothetical protein [Actinomycetota bacterium]